MYSPGNPYFNLSEEGQKQYWYHVQGNGFR